jgi:hypothetical protein
VRPITLHLSPARRANASPTRRAKRRIVTNPAEVSKTRLQLDGELQGRKGAILPVKPAVAGVVAEAPVIPAALQKSASGKVYSGPIDCLQKTWKFEGIRGVQRGLGAAVSRAAEAGRVLL